MTEDQIPRGLLNLGGAGEKYPQRKFLIMRKDFTDAEQTVPMRIFWGHTEICGSYITPIFNFKSVQLTQNVGK